MIRLLRRLSRLAVRFLPSAAAAGVAGIAVLSVTQVDRNASALSVVLAIAVFALVLASPLLLRVVSVPVVAAIRLPGFVSPASVPRRRKTILLISALVPLVVVAALSLRNVSWVLWLCLAAVLIAGCVELAIAWQAWRSVRRTRADLPRLRSVLNESGVRFAIYTTRGASHRSAYQLQAWLSELQRGGQRGVVIVRDATAIAEYAAVTDWPIVLCPRTADLEIVTASNIRAVFYLNQVARNTDMVAWRGPRHVYLGHGDSNKMLSSHPAHAMYDEIWVAGQHSIDRYRAAGVVIEPSKFVVIGRPQLAVLGESTGSRAGRNLEAESSSTRPTALYAPTWHGYNSLTQLSSLTRGPQIVDELTSAGFDVIFRPHPMSALTRQGRAKVAEVRSRVTKKSHVAQSHRTFVSAAAETDLLVADPSSVVVDFLATGRPVIVILPSKSVPSGATGSNHSTDGAVLGLDARVLPALYQVDSSLQNLSETIADATGSDSLRLARLKVRDELFGEAPAAGWTKDWDEQLARVLA